jgi:hypothetical protein
LSNHKNCTQTVMPDIENIKEEGFMEHVPDNKEEVNENV